MRVLIVLLLLSTIGISCSKEDSTVDPTKIDIVTGIVVHKLDDDEGVLYGNPNEKIGYRYVDNKKVKDIIVYPSLFKDGAFIYASDTIRKIWIVKGKVEYHCPDINYQDLLKDYTYSNKELASASEDSVTANVKRYYLSLSGWEEGFYRIFVKTDSGDLYWTNICKDSNPEGERGFYNMYDNYWH
ncbi:MAG: hypothetical protein JW717_09235 [Marinilabiliaceae bacterium]|nr:hypothetical protein [Marinilabiliaceae bacterium]